MLAEQMRRTSAHALDVERAMFVVRKTTHDGRRIAPLEHDVPIAPFERREPCRKTRVDARGVARGKVRRQRRVERDRKPVDRKRVVRHERNDLATRVNARIGPPRDRHLDRTIEEP